MKFFGFPLIKIVLQQLRMILEGKKQFSSRKTLMEEEDSLWPTYYFCVTNDDNEDLEFGIFNVKIDIGEDPTEIKQFFKLLTARKMKTIYTATDAVKKIEIEYTGIRPRNTQAKRICKKKLYLAF